MCPKNSARRSSKHLGASLHSRNNFPKAAINLFGSGWVWLVLSNAGALKIVSTQGHDNPLMTGDKPLMVIDVWEHAYYLKYQNRRQEYIQNWWNVVDWKAVDQRLNDRR